MCFNSVHPLQRHLLFHEEKSILWSFFKQGLVDVRPCNRLNGFQQHIEVHRLGKMDVDAAFQGTAAVTDADIGG